MTVPEKTLNAFLRLDPSYSVSCPCPDSPVESGAPFWYYYPEDLECFWLQELRRAVRETHLRVGYPGVFRTLTPSVHFFCGKSQGLFRFRACGRVGLYLNGTCLGIFEPSYAVHAVYLPEGGEVQLAVSVTDTARDIPAVMTFEKEAWMVCASWSEPRRPAACECRPVSGVTPHHARNPRLLLPLEQLENGLWDAGREVLGVIEIHAEGQPTLYVGESMAEARNAIPEHMEQGTQLVSSGSGVWRSRHELAFRYLRMEGAKPSRVICHASYASLQYKGMFTVTGADELNRIWAHAAYTLRLCVNHFLLDGLKRDRLPWGGDLVISLLGMGYSFGDRECPRRSLKVLGANLPAGHDVNTLVDYSMWLIICHDLYQLFFADRELLIQEYPRICRKVEELLQQYDLNQFASFPHSRPLIDWGKPPIEHALIMLFNWTLRAGMALARRMQDYGRLEAWTRREAQVRYWLNGHARRADGLYYGERPEQSERPGRHVNIFAVLSGVAQGDQANAIARWLAGTEAPEVATPYMAILDAMAIARGGCPQLAIRKIERLWGGMLKLGATSFWEAYDESQRNEQHLAFYDRKFGKSLCHAWGSGPVFALPQIILGLMPLEDGWRKFTVTLLPQNKAGKLYGRVPTPYGCIEVSGRDGKVRVQAPPECQRV